MRRTAAGRRAAHASDGRRAYHDRYSAMRAPAPPSSTRPPARATHPPDPPPSSARMLRLENCLGRSRSGLGAAKESTQQCMAGRFRPFLGPSGERGDLYGIFKCNVLLFTSSLLLIYISCIALLLRRGVRLCSQVSAGESDWRAGGWCCWSGVGGRRVSARAPAGAVSRARRRARRAAANVPGPPCGAGAGGQGVVGVGASGHASWRQPARGTARTHSAACCALWWVVCRLAAAEAPRPSHRTRPSLVQRAQGERVLT